MSQPHAARVGCGRGKEAGAGRGCCMAEVAGETRETGEPALATSGSPEVLPVYVRTRPVSGLGWQGRAVAAMVAAGCVGVLWVAATISPDARGLGTHEQLGMAPCGFVQIFGLPCPSCGFTTSFALFVRLRWLASAWNQPMGFLLALACTVSAWGGLYAAATGVAIHRLAMVALTPRRVVWAVGLFLLAWAWKITLVKVLGGGGLQ